MNEPKVIKWIDVQNVNDQFFLLAALKYANQEKRIRFAIDKRSANGIRSVLNEKPFKGKYGEDYSYWYSGYSIDKTKNEYEHYIEIRLGKMRHKMKVQCSRFFCENLRWLSEIESISEIDNISYYE